MKAKLYFLCGLFVLTGIHFSSCSTRRVEQEMSGATSQDPQIAEGRRVFKMNCQKCHPGGESGVGPEINTIRVPGFLLKCRVRSRAFLLWTGRMPQFDKQEISPKELKALVAFIKVMQRDERNKKQ